MNAINLSVEVHCIRPPWGQYNTVGIFNDSRYRIYISNDLITERSWVWNNNTFLLENIWILPNSKNEHVLKLEPVVTIPEQAKFFLERLIFKDINADIHKINDLQINFSFR